MADVFISYKQEDRHWATQIAGALEQCGLTVWWDMHLRAGETFDKKILSELEACRAGIVLWSTASVVSEWVRSEASYLSSRGVLVTVMIEPCRLPPPFNMKHTPSLAGWNGDQEHAQWRGILLRLGELLETSLRPSDRARTKQYSPSDEELEAHNPRRKGPRVLQGSSKRLRLYLVIGATSLVATATSFWMYRDSLEGKFPADASQLNAPDPSKQKALTPSLGETRSAVNTAQSSNAISAVSAAQAPANTEDRAGIYYAVFVLGFSVKNDALQYASEISEKWGANASIYSPLGSDGYVVRIGPYRTYQEAEAKLNSMRERHFQYNWYVRKFASN